MSDRDAKKIALQLRMATALPDSQVFPELDQARYTTVDYHRMACHLLFECKRCGNCCRTGDPIRLRPEDVGAIARQLKIPLNRAMKKFAIADPERPGVYNFKHILPCKFYDNRMGGCKIYDARPWSCRIFPFLGIYGSEDRVVVNESCPGAVETMLLLTIAMQELSSGQSASTGSAGSDQSVPDPQRPDLKGVDPKGPDPKVVDPDEIREAKRLLRRALESV